MKIKVSDIKRAIKDIQKLNVDLRRLGMRSTPDIVGFYGELLVWKELKSRFGWRGYNVEFGSGQSKADIILIKNNKKINVEVKTSRLKEEGYGYWFGAALNIKKCRKQGHEKRFYSHSKKGKVFGDFCYFDYLVFVAIDRSFLNPKFYIIPRSFIERYEKSLRNTHERFSSATHRIILSDNGRMPNLPIAQKKLIRKTERFQNLWEI